ncbi:glycosyltransferase family 9 protein [Thiohalophilus sp.]|uniref:glycosyltransferase family 9 protein n=1 Tax=Thiohalophilus sp. TaxID=3028392 RepID=UPI002ACEF824|nr:glycosyltransferase family 9 protein [Thiohalophilus sp.]MDZ7661034.1 glycosyltransferase family 9 protein [Thiohalophilus sp.]
MPATANCKILIVRNDKLGDFMLSLPVFAALKQNLPHCELHALVPAYTREIAEASPWIDRVILDPGQQATLSDQWEFVRQIRRTDYQALITLFSTTRVGLFGWLAGIPVRFAPATKLAQVFYNHRITQRRSRSLKPEHEYNLDLALAYLASQGIHNPPKPGPPYLRFPAQEISSLRQAFAREHAIDADRKLVFVHPGSGGSANNLGPEQYAELITRLSANPSLHFVLSAGPGEQQGVEKVSELIARVPHTRYLSDRGLTDFARHLAFADAFIAGSTGPLHLAGALDRPTVGFYTRRRSATPLRWQTLNRAGRRLAITPPEQSEAEDMRAIDINAAAKTIGDFLEQLDGPPQP